MVLRQCNVCGRKFTKTEHYKRHERSHTRERPYRCTICEKAFSRSDVLFRHMKCHAERTDSSSANASTSAARRSTISEGVAPKLTQETFSTQTDVPNQSHNGIPLMQILSPSNYAGPNETGLTSRTRHSSLDIPPSYMNTPSNQQQQVDLHIPTEWNSISSPNASMNPPQQIPHLRSSPSQQSVDASTFETSLSGSGLRAQTPRSDMASNQFGHTDPQWLPQSGGMAHGDFHDPFQMWLFPSLGDLEQSPDFLQTYGTGASDSFQMQDTKLHADSRPQDSAERTKAINKVPRERFSRVQRCWAPRPHRQHRLMPVLWREVILSPLENLFAEAAIPLGDPKAGTNWGLDGDCRYRLKDSFRTPAPSAHQSPKVSAALDPSMLSQMQDNAEFPPAEILDIALGLFFRKFHPTVPFIHVPTFCVKNTPSSFLFSICLIGLSILGTTGATRFVSRMFPSFVQRVCSDLSSCTSGTSNTTQQLTIFATALLTLNLVAFTGDKDCTAHSQMLYVTLLSMAQQNGLFAADDGQSLDALLAETAESGNAWKAWCRTESTKRLIMGLLQVDSWYANLLSKPPIIRSEAVCIIAPCDEILFQAKSATQWQSLLRSGKRQVAPKIRLSDLHSQDPAIYPPLGYLGSSTLLALLQIQMLESYHRLMPASQTTVGSYIPWQVYAHDARANTLSASILASTSILNISSPRITDTNTKVLYHSLSIMLLSDFRLFELAAGRHGAAPAQGALEDISRWSSTVSARRACVHAAQTFKLMSERKVSDNVTIHSVCALFASALVLGLYSFMAPPSPQNHYASSSTPTELVEVDLDWSALSDLGFSDDVDNTTTTNNNNKSNTQQQPPHSPRDTSNPTSIVENFIKYGGSISLSGVPQHGGYESARRVLLDFANLMDGISGRKLRTFTQVLHIMSDDLMNVDAAL